MMAAELLDCLKELRLPAVRELYLEQAEQERREGHSYEHYLAELMEHEVEQRRHKRVARMPHESSLPLEKTNDALELDRLPPSADAQLSILLEGGFLDRHENVLVFGNPGSGKSHLLCALAQELVHQDRRVLFRTCDVLVQELLRAKAELKLDRALKRLSRYTGLLIDDIGYVQQSRQEMEVLFTVLAHRYERRSVLLTSNLAFSQWEQIFKDPMTTAAAIDRRVHHSTIIELNIPSYRLEAAKANGRKKSPSPTGEGPKDGPHDELPTGVLIVVDGTD